MTNAHRIQRPTTDQAAAQKLAVRFNHPKECWEVYTFLTGAFDTSWRWFEVDYDVAEWYLNAKKAHRADDVQKEKEKQV